MKYLSFRLIMPAIGISRLVVVVVIPSALAVPTAVSASTGTIIEAAAFLLRLKITATTIPPTTARVMLRLAPVERPKNPLVSKLKHRDDDDLCCFRFYRSL